MKRLIVMVALAMVLAGCSGVVLNAEYSALLDDTAALSAETAKLADANALSPATMKTALRYQAAVWQRFRDARDGRRPEGGK